MIVQVVNLPLLAKRSAEWHRRKHIYAKKGDKLLLRAWVHILDTCRSSAGKPPDWYDARKLFWETIPGALMYDQDFKAAFLDIVGNFCGRAEAARGFEIVFRAYLGIPGLALC